MGERRHASAPSHAGEAVSDTPDMAARQYLTWNEIAPRVPWLTSRAKLLRASAAGTAPPYIRANRYSQPYWDARQIQQWITDRERALDWPDQFPPGPFPRFRA